MKKYFAFFVFVILYSLLYFGCSKKKHFELTDVKKISLFQGFVIPAYSTSDTQNFLIEENLGGGELILYIFDLKKGKILDAVYIKKGRAPGEITSFGLKGGALFKNRIYLYDQLRHLVNIYDLKGNFIKELTIKQSYNKMGKAKDFFILTTLNKIDFYDSTGNKTFSLNLFKEENESIPVTAQTPPAIFTDKNKVFIADVVNYKIMGIDIYKRKIIFEFDSPKTLKGYLEKRRKGNSVIIIPRNTILSMCIYKNFLLVSRMNEDTTKTGIDVIDMKNKNIVGFIATYKPVRFIGVLHDKIYYIKKSTVFSARLREF